MGAVFPVALAFGLVAAGISVVAVLALLAILGVMSIGDVPMNLIAQTIAARVTAPGLLAIPLFLLMAEIMNESGISRRVLDLCMVLVGHLKGGLAQVNVVFSAFFGGLSGSAAADAVWETKVLVPMMERGGYSSAFAAAITAASAIVTPVIPPSIAMIIYASITDVSVGRMFMAGIIPGIVILLFQAITCHVVSIKRNYGGARPRATKREFLSATRSAAWALVLPIVIIGGIYAGVFTPTESAAIGCAYCVLVGALLHREIRLSQFPGILLRTAVGTGLIMLIIGVAAPMQWVMAVTRLSDQIFNTVQAIRDPFVFLLVVNLILLVLGCFVEGTTLLILAAPLLAPMANAVGIDPIHFGIIVVVNVQVGTITPPFGQIVFFISSIGKIPAEAIFKELWLFVPALLGSLIFVTYMPNAYLWVANLLVP